MPLAELIVICSAILIQSTLSFVLIFGGVRGVRTGIFYERTHPIDVWASRLFGVLLLCALFGAELVQPTQKMHEHGHLIFIGAVFLGFIAARYIRKLP